MYSLTLFHPHHALLGDGGCEFALLVVDPTNAQAPPAIGRRGGHVEQQPAGHVDVRVPPQGVIEAGNPQARISPCETVNAQARFKHREVTGIGQDRGGRSTAVYACKRLLQTRTEAVDGLGLSLIHI